jgi:L-amino acid N-acyltransferase YncA
LCRILNQSATWTTRSGFKFLVRPAVADDEAALAEFFTHVADDDLRFRFLSGQRKVSHDQLATMLRNDNQTESFLAFAPNGILIATAMLACDAAIERGEVAIAIRADYKGRGVGWELLEYIAHYAEKAGIRTLEAVESRENHAAIELERELGFTVTGCPGDATLVIVRRDLIQTSFAKSA